MFFCPFSTSFFFVVVTLCIATLYLLSVQTHVLKKIRALYNRKCLEIIMKNVNGIKCDECFGVFFISTCIFFFFSNDDNNGLFVIKPVTMFNIGKQVLHFVVVVILVTCFTFSPLFPFQKLYANLFFRNILSTRPLYVI